MGKWVGMQLIHSQRWPSIHTYIGLPTDHDFYNIGVGFLSTWAMLYVIKVIGKSLLQAQILSTLWTLLLDRGREAGGDGATRRTLMLCFNQVG